MVAGPEEGISLEAGQRKAVERLKISLFGNDPYVRSKYIQDFHREFRSYKRRIDRDRLIAACAKTDIVFVGDYHALPSCQNFAAELIDSLSDRGRPLVVFLEMIFSRDQKVLDERLAGRIGDEDLKRRIHYERDWGYPWDGYGRLLESARRAGAELVAADAPPRGGLRMIRRRDRHAASAIVERLLASPRSRAVVLFGESHMAKGHLPREVSAELARRHARRSSVVVVQNVEEIYWDVSRGGGEPAEAVAIDGDRYCVFNASPLAKYEAYRQTLLRWSQQAEEEPDFGPSVHHLIDLLAARLGIDSFRNRALSPDGRRVPLVDLYPEVLARRERRRARRARPPQGRRIRRPGVVYRAGPNRVDVYSFSLAAAGDAASRFLMTALRGRIGQPGGGPYTGRPGPGEGSARCRSAAAGSRGLGGSLPLAGLIVDESFVAFSVRFLDPGVPASAVIGEDRASRPERAKAGARGRVRDLLEAAAGGSAGSAGRERRGRSGKSGLGGLSGRGLVGARGIGEKLGEAIYARLRNQPPSKAARTWLQEAARFGAGPHEAAKAARLLEAAAALAGWKR